MPYANGRPFSAKAFISRSPCLGDPPSPCDRSARRKASQARPHRGRPHAIRPRAGEWIYRTMVSVEATSQDLRQHGTRRDCHACETGTKVVRPTPKCMDVRPWSGAPLRQEGHGDLGRSGDRVFSKQRASADNTDVQLLHSHAYVVTNSSHSIRRRSATKGLEKEAIMTLKNVQTHRRHAMARPGDGQRSLRCCATRTCRPAFASRFEVIGKRVNSASYPWRRII